VTHARRLTVGLVLATAVITPAAADDLGCQLPPAVGREFSWSEGAQVTVYIDPNFSGGAIAEIEAGIGAWENAGGSGVHFNFSIDYGHAHLPHSGSMGVIPGTTSSGSAAENRLTGGGSHLDHAQMVIDTSQVFTADLFRRISVHETGHSFGLGDCQGCGNKTVMASPLGPLTQLTPCDQHAARLNGGYSGPVPGQPNAPGPSPRPPSCTDCIVQDCTTTQVCTKDGNSEWSCGPEQTTCDSRSGCCRTDAAAATEADPCGNWRRADACEFGSVCCTDQTPNTQCSSHGWWEGSQQGDCEVACGGTCTETEIWVLDQGHPLGSAYCWQCPGAPNPGPSCGAIGGDYCSPSGSCPGGYDSLGNTYDCAPCCKSQPPPPPPDPGPSCGAIGGDYCSQSGSCPSGHDTLGNTYDCAPCCKSQPPPPPPDPGPSCGAIGGDYCSQSGSCPSGHDTLGNTYDCAPCCRTAACESTGCPPSACGVQTDNCGNQIWCGDCCQPQGCPGWGIGWQPDGCGGWNWCGDPDPCGGDPCCGDPCCGDPCCGDPCCGDPCCGDFCCQEPWQCGG